MLDKLKQFSILLFKLIVVAGAFYFIYNKVVENGQISFEELAAQFNRAFSRNIPAILLLIALSIVNWSFEIKKWQTLVNTVRKTSFVKAAEQCLASLTAAHITPNKVGEYAAKAAYFEKADYEKIVLLNGVSHMLQLSTTIIFGSFGIIYMFQHFKIEIPNIPAIKTSLLLVFVIIAILAVKTFKWEKLKKKLHQYKEILVHIPKTVLKKTFLFAVLRYLSFSHQFYFLLYMFGIDISYSEAINLIFASYLITSVVPSISLFDWAVKGSIAVWAFSFAGVNELSIVAITSIMWILNYALPSLVGSVFIMRFKVNI